MARRGYGRIVNISSIWSLVAKPGRAAYAVSKSGLNGLTRSLAVELAAHNVLVNAIAPGFIATEMTYRNNSTEEVAAMIGQVPAGRLGSPAEIAEIVAFFASAPQLVRPDRSSCATAATHACERRADADWAPGLIAVRSRLKDYAVEFDDGDAWAQASPGWTVRLSSSTRTCCDLYGEGSWRRSAGSAVVTPGVGRAQGVRHRRRAV